MIATIRRYRRVWAACLRNCLARELEFRSSFVLTAASTLFGSVFSIVLAMQVFSNVREVAGWDLDRMFVLTGTYLIVRGFGTALVQPNMQRLADMVNKGELDFVLIRPISSQFLVSVRYVNFGALFTSMVGFSYVVIGLGRLGLVPGPVETGAYLLTLGCALLSVYAIWFMSVTLVLWTGRINNISSAFDAFLFVGRMPSDVFRGIVGTVITMILPVALVATLPAKALLGVLEPALAPYQIGLTIVLLWGSHRFWHHSLRQYTSAS